MVLSRKLIPKENAILWVKSRIDFYPLYHRVERVSERMGVLFLHWIVGYTLQLEHFQVRRSACWQGYDLHCYKPSLLGGRPSLRGAAGNASSCSQRGNNRSVMPLDVSGCIRATLSTAASRLGFPLAGKLNLATALVLGTDGCIRPSRTRNS